jgi:hypothetical protein
MKKSDAAKLKLSLETLRSQSELDLPRGAMETVCPNITRQISGCTTA